MMITCIRKLVILDINRFFYRRNIILFSIFVFLLLVLLIDGTYNYKNSQTNIYKFQEVESKQVNQYVYYTQYGTYGINLLFVPGPMSTLSNFFLNDLTSSVNSGERLNIFIPIKSNNLFSQMKDFYLSPAGYLMLIFGSFSILLGYETYHNREYIKFLASLYPYKKLQMILLISRIILLFLFLLFIFILFLACLFIYGINLLNIHFLIFSGITFLLFVFLLLIGFVVGMLRSKPVRLVALVLIFFLFFFVFQGIVTKVVEKRAAFIKSHYDLHLEKLKLIMSVERDSFNKFGRFESGKEAPEDLKRFVKQAVHNEFDKLSRYETKMREEISANVSFFHFISCLFPTTFYRSVCHEISSNGFLNFLDYYKHTQELKRQFLDFYVEKKFFSESTPGKVESFVKDKENIFFSTSKLPRNFLLGLLLTFFFIVGLTLLSFYMFKRYLFLPSSVKKLDFNLKRGKSRVCLTSSEDVKNFVYNHFYREFAARDFIYICHPDHIPPDIRVKYFIPFVSCLLEKDLPQNSEVTGNFTSLDYKEKAGILFLLLDADYKLIIFNEIESDAFDQLEFLTDHIKKLKKKSAILYLTKHIFFASRIYDESYIIPHPIDNINL